MAGRLSRQKARYAIYGIIGLFAIFQIAGHDQSILLSITAGSSDISAVNQLFIQTDLETIRLIVISSIVGMVVLTGYAIAIRIAQSKNREIHPKTQ